MVKVIKSRGVATVFSGELSSDGDDSSTQQQEESISDASSASRMLSPGAEKTAPVEASNIVALNADEAQVPQLTEEEMRQDIREKTASLRELVSHYQLQHQTMQEEVAEFIIRDVEEQNAMHKLNATVLQSQKDALQNSDYTRWASTYSKGEFSEKYGKNDINSDGTLRRFDDGHVDEYLWMHELMQSGKGSSRDELHCTPYFVLLDSVGSTVMNILKGYRSVNNKNITKTLNDFFNATFGEMMLSKQHNKAKKVTSRVLFLNGKILWPPVVLDDDPAPEIVSAFSLRHSTMNNAFDVEATYDLWLQYMCETYFSSPSTTVFFEKITASLLHPSTQKLLRDDANVLVLIDNTTATTNHLPLFSLRSFTFNRVVRAIDLLGPQLCPLIDVKAAELALTKASELLLQNPNLNPSTPKNVVLTFAVPAICNTISDITLVDVCGVSPSVPFNHFPSLAWADLCGLARQSNDDGTVVVSRIVTSRIAVLVPYDETTKRWFSALNALLKGCNPSAEISNKTSRAAISVTIQAALLLAAVTTSATIGYLLAKRK